MTFGNVNLNIDFNKKLVFTAKVNNLPITLRKKQFVVKDMYIVLAENMQQRL